MSGTDSDAVGVLRRWETFGATWRVLDQDESSATVAMCRCDGGGEVDRLVSSDPAVLEYLRLRPSSEAPDQS